MVCEKVWHLYPGDESAKEVKDTTQDEVFPC